MDTQIYLIVPAAMPVESIDAALRRALADRPAAALLLPRGGRSDDDYLALAQTLVPLAQAGGAAALVEGQPEFVRQIGADGMHVHGDVDAVRLAIKALSPDFIVGAGDIRSRHDAMQKGELGVDYILFGPLSGRISPREREIAQWWAETMEIPGVLCDPESRHAELDAAGCEFAGLNLTPGSLA